MRETLTFHIAVALCLMVSVPALWLSRRVIKPWLGYETAIYRWWWRRHSENIQHRLDRRSGHRHTRQ